MALQLDRDDQIIRRRLIHKMEYIAQGFYDEIAPPSEQQLREYYRKNQEDYRRPAEATFTHIFIGFDRRDPGPDETAAGGARKSIMRPRPPATLLGF